MKREAIADILDNIADILELKGENPFKIRAYRNGARALEGLGDRFEQHIAEGDLDAVNGIGKALVEKITTLYEDKPLPFYENLRDSIPDGLVAMLDIPELGPKKLRKLHDALGVSSTAELKAACEAGQVAELNGFGETSQAKLLNNIRNREAYTARHLWWEAAEPADRILKGLRKLDAVEHAEAAGSFRRGKETVGDLDFIVASTSPEPIMGWFCEEMDGIQAVLARGKTKSSVRLHSGMQADLRIVPPDRFAFALHHFTGSKEHNVRMRQRALERGYSMSEWGLFRSDNRAADQQDTPASERTPDLSASTEAELFAALELPYIVPELREDRGEIEAAEADRLPELVTLNDLKGVFHNHTTESDGQNTLEEMVEAAQGHGWDYYGVADHSKASFQASGLDEARLEAQIKAIHELNASGRFTTHVFAGSEVDILADGTLDFDDGMLKQLDYTVVSVHNAFSQDEATMTRRIIRALEQERTTMLGHVTGRLLLRREPYAVAVEKVIDAAIANEKIIELNANPYRLDMDWRYWRRATERGLLCAINPDAHHRDHLAFCQLGINIARKGWLTPDTILNTWPLEKVKSRLQFAK